MSRINGQLEKAQLENLAADPGTASLGLIYFNTVSLFPRFNQGGWRTLVDAESAQVLTGKTMNGLDITSEAELLAQAPIRFYPPAGVNYVALLAPDTLAATTSWKLPVADGTTGQVLKTDGSGNLGWASVASSLAQYNVLVGDSGGVAVPTDTNLLGDVAASTASSVVTISNGSPGVITWASHGLVRGDSVYFTTTGTLPTGLLPNTGYFVVDSTTNTFNVALYAGEVSINTSSAGSGVHTAYSGGFKFRNGVVRPYIILDGGNGVDTTNNRVRRFSTFRQPQQGFPDFSYADSAANGTTITINTAGLYFISYCDRFDAGAGNIAITVNADTTPQSGSAGDVEIAISSISSASLWTEVSATVFLKVGDVVRAVADSGGVTFSTNISVKFRIHRLD